MVEAESDADARDWAAANSLLVTSVFEIEPPPLVTAGDPRTPPVAPVEPEFKHVDVSIVEQSRTLRDWMHQTSSIGCGIALGWALILILTVSGFIVFGAAIYNLVPRPPGSGGLGGSRSVAPAGP